jgi:hypothetical protein
MCSKMSAKATRYLFSALIVLALVFCAAPGSTYIYNPKQVKTITVTSPTSSENDTILFTPAAITLLQVHAAIVGSTSATMQIMYGTDRSASGTAAIASTAVSNTTGGADITITSASVAANSYVWLVTTALSGTPSELTVTIVYR